MYLFISLFVFLFYLLLCNRSLHSNCLQITHSLHYVDLDHLKFDVANGASLVKSVIKFGSKCIALVLVVVFHMGHIGKHVVFTLADEVSFI